MKNDSIHQLVNLVTDKDLSYNFDDKEKFHSLGRSVLKKIAKSMGLAPGSFEIHNNRGGIAVSGEVTLHGERIYIQFSQSILGHSKFMFRSCQGMKDYTGGFNQWMKWADLTDYDVAIQRFISVAESGI